jgi:ABC-type oligopeptide transport system ATPase subunit
MIKTKLILVDGISGSGKSTTAHYIFRQLEKNGIKVRWYYEQEKNHPLHVNEKEAEKKKDESDADYSKRIMEKYPEIWNNFVNLIKDDDSVYIVESFFLQDVLLFPHFMNDLDRQIIKDYSHKMLEIVRSLDPILIHLYKKDANKAVKANWERRGEEWTNWFVKMFEESAFCKNRNLKGKEGNISLFQDFTDFCVELFQEYDFRKLQIENSEYDWETYRQKICDFLELKNVEEKLFDSSYSRYFGEYLGPGYIFKVHLYNNRLCIDAFWPNLKLLPVSKNEFEMEGFPISVKFYRYKGKKRFKFSKALCYFTEGKTAEEYTPYLLSVEKIEKFCGVYWCDKEKLERKLYLKDGKFYYWREEGNQSRLIPISDTQFMMVTDVENKIEFKKVKGKWQFTFDVYEKKPIHSLFLLKSDDVEIEKEKA